MASNKPVILLLGAGVNTGLATAKKFHAQGWQVACVSRSEKPEFKPFQSLFVQGDFTDPKSIEAAFHEVEQKIGIPNVVIYNAYAVTFSENADDLYADISVEAFAENTQVNVVSNFAAIKLAIAGFKKLPADAIKAYIYTGNMCTGIIVPQTLTLGSGKNASLYLIESTAALYGDLAKWYFADERDAQGNSTMHKIDGEAHAEAFWDLAHDKQQHELNYTFVKGKKGYIGFDVDRPSRPVASAAELFAIAEANA